MSRSMTLGSTMGNESEPGSPTAMPITMGVGVEMQTFSEGDQSDPAPKAFDLDLGRTSFYSNSKQIDLNPQKEGAETKEESVTTWCNDAK